MPNGNILQELISQGKTVNKEQPQSFDQLNLLQEAVQKELLKIKTEETRNLANQGYKAEQIAQANNFSLDPNTQGKNVLQKLMSSLPAIAEVLSEGQYSQSKLREAQIQRQQQMSQDKGFYQFNPTTGELEQVATIPKGAEVRNRQISPQERAQAYGEVSKDVATYKENIKRESPERVSMATSLDQMDILLNDMEQYLVKDPNVFVKGLNPLGEREFKAILQNFDKTSAIAAGGKQLTKTELDLIRNTRPTLLDTKNPKAIAYKFNILRSTLGLAKERLNKGTKYEKEKSQEQPRKSYKNLWE